MSGGATDPSLSTPIAALGDTEFDFICSPFTDSTNIGLLTTFLNHSTGRWSPSQQLYGVVFSAKDDTSSNLATSGSSLNDPNLTIMGYNKGSSPPWKWAAAYAAVATRLQFASEASRPMQTLPLLGILGPKLLSDRFTQTQRAALYVDGIASYKVAPGNVITIDRAITTYQSNALGAADTSWLDVESRFQAMFVVRYMRNKITEQHGRNALREDNPLRLPNVSTPDNIRDTIVHGYRELSNANLVENFEGFANGLVVERNTADPSRVDVFLPVDLVNGLRIFAVNATFFQNIQGNEIAA
jgi:phage tail sheath gpL-like